jgi:hypothetical protein
MESGNRTALAWKLGLVCIGQAVFVAALAIAVCSWRLRCPIDLDPSIWNWATLGVCTGLLLWWSDPSDRIRGLVALAVPLGIGAVFVAKKSMELFCYAGETHGGAETVLLLFAGAALTIVLLVGYWLVLLGCMRRIGVQRDLPAMGRLSAWATGVGLGGVAAAVLAWIAFPKDFLGPVGLWFPAACGMLVLALPLGVIGTLGLGAWGLTRKC